MYLQKLRILNFKNFEEWEMEFNSRITCIIGQNGVGKTNILDAIYYLSFCKSNFVTDQQVVKMGEDSFFVQGDYDESLQISAGFSTEKKKHIKCDGKKYDRISNHIGVVPLIFITPSDINIINGGGSERRRFLDSFISQYDRGYLQDLIDYNKTIAQRNKVLKTVSRFGYDTIEAYDYTLASLAEKIALKRAAVLDEILPVFLNYYGRIKSEEAIEVIYNTQVRQGEFLQLLKDNFERDAILKHTSVGIHRDDVEFTLNDLPLRQTGSQGQKKTILYALKFAKYKIIAEKLKKQPLILLDDMFDKLDKERTMKIISLLHEESFGQIFITDTDKTPIQLLENSGEKDIQLITI